MATIRIHFEQVYFKLQDVRDSLDMLREQLPIVADPAPVIRMGGGFHRPGGLDDWFIDLDFGTNKPDEHTIDNAIADLPYTMGIAVSA